MSTVMLVAGSSTNDLTKFLQNRGALEVSYQFESLLKHQEVLKTGMHIADKLVYVYQNNSISIRKDMQILQELLISDAFFQVKEIVFFVVETEETSEGLRYFKAVMEAVKEAASKNRSVLLPEYNIRKSEDRISFDIIYNALLGMSEELNIDNSFKSVYRVERNSESSRAYEPDDSSKMVVEPFSYRGISDYKSAQDSARVTDSGELLIDPSDKNAIEKIDADLGQLEFEQSDQNLKVVVVSGNAKSGVTTFACALAVSASVADNRVLLVDLSKNKGVPFVMKNLNVPYESIDVKSLLLKQNLRQEQNLAIIHEFDAKMRIHMLRNIISNVHRYSTNMIIIDAGPDDLEVVTKHLNRFKVRTFLLSCPTDNDLDQVAKLFEQVSSADLILSNNINFTPQFKEVPVEQIRSRVSNVGRMSMPLALTDLDLDESLASAFLGVR
jgi:hypothetical protein